MFWKRKKMIGKIMPTSTTVPNVTILDGSKLLFPSFQKMQTLLSSGTSSLWCSTREQREQAMIEVGDDHADSWHRILCCVAYPSADRHSLYSHGIMTYHSH